MKSAEAAEMMLYYATRVRGVSVTLWRNLNPLGNDYMRWCVRRGLPPETRRWRKHRGLRDGCVLRPLRDGDPLILSPAGVAACRRTLARYAERPCRDYPRGYRFGRSAKGRRSICEYCALQDDCDRCPAFSSACPTGKRVRIPRPTPDPANPYERPSRDFRNRLYAAELGMAESEGSTVSQDSAFRIHKSE